MKTANFIKVLFLFLAIGITSCSSESTDESGGGTNAGLVLTANKTRVYDFTLVNFTVMNGSTDVTSDAIISIDGTAISGNSATMSGLGNKTVTAMLGTDSTNAVNVTVLTPSFTTKSLIEDYTGAWCGWCPRISQGIIDVHNGANGDRVVAIAVHNGDTMAFPLEGQMRGQFGVQGFPTGIINRAADWSATSGSDMNLSQPVSYLSAVKPVGLAINSSLSGNSVSADVKVGFDLDQEGLRLVVVLLENGKIAAQTNYTNNWGGASTINNFEHNDILRSAFTDVFGDVIPAADQLGGSEYSVSLTTTIPSGTNTADMDIVAFVVDATGKVVNVQHAEVGANVDFD